MCAGLVGERERVGEWKCARKVVRKGGVEQKTWELLVSNSFAPLMPEDVAKMSCGCATKRESNRGDELEQKTERVGFFRVGEWVATVILVQVVLVFACCALSRAGKGLGDRGELEESRVSVSKTRRRRRKGKRRGQEGEEMGQ